ncbi:MAG: MFS transporter [Alphaproteobacteria bacterium]|nr:MFS transporter [Alphaproteobacteria bacterium]MCB9930218.1 MFS transporter [Alphaproteobacteria bacterium]
MSLRDRLAILCIGIGTAVVPLDSAVNIAFPDITRAFGIEIQQIQWVVIAYVLTHTSLMLFCGRIGDRIGRRLVFSAGLVWSTGAFVVLTLAPSFEWLLAARVAQGIGAALVGSCGPALITGLAGEERRARMLGLFMLMFGIAMALGPSVGGLMVAWVGWPGVYGMRVPLCLIALALVWSLPARTAEQRAAAADTPMNVAGALLLAAAMAALLFTVNRLQVAGSNPVLPAGLAGLTAVMVALLLRHESRSPAPILPLYLFRRAAFSGVVVANMAVAFAGFAVMLIVPYFLARLTALEVTVAGLVLACSPLGTAVVSLVAGRLVERLGARRTAGLAAGATALGLAGIGCWPAFPGVVAMIVPLFLAGAGMGLFLISSMDVITGTMRLEERGVAGSLAQVSRTVGVMTAASLLSLAFATLGGGQGATDAAFLKAFGTVFLAAAVLPALVALAMARGGR